MPAAFLFDIDGTLVDSVDLHARAWQEAFAHFGLDIPYEQVRSLVPRLEQDRSLSADIERLARAIKDGSLNS